LSPPTRLGISPRYDLDAKWDACLDLSIRRVAYSSLAGAFGGLSLFRAAFTECSYIFNGSPPKWLAPECSIALTYSMVLLQSGESHVLDAT
uniref:Uncharacterized protein n=1 Tax=Aegilops tauschii subsp. strangulata TaxID=200361 RepID=A0A453J2R0_AEGTS